MHQEPQTRTKRRVTRALSSPVVPIALMAGFIILAAIVWSALRQQVDQQVALNLNNEVTSQVRELETSFRRHVSALERMASRLEQNPDLSRANWAADAREMLRDFQFFEAVEWIDRSYIIRWVEPLADNRKLIGFNVAFSGDRESELAAAAAYRHTNFSGIISLQQGGTGIVAYSPVVRGGVSQGYVAGVFRMNNLLTALMASRTSNNFQIDVIEGNEVRFSLSQEAELAPDRAETLDLEMPGLDWRLRLIPTRQWLEDNYQDWSPTALLGLLVLGFMISALVWLAQVAMLRNRSLTEARTELEREIFQRESIQQDLARMESTDTLTGLANRRFFMEDMAHTLAIADRHFRQVALITLDLDRFQLLNDSLGHQFGDELLIKVADRLNQLSDEKVLVAYSSGDEFLFCQQHVDELEDVIALLRQIKRCFGEAFVVQGQDFHLTATMGVAIYPQSGLDADMLMRNADVALFRAKENGRNHYQFYTEGMQDREVTRLQLDKDLTRALKENELVLHFQPQLDLATQQIGSVEALVRWQHPTRGLLPPGEFIPLAEESGRIADIGRWVALAACRQLATWQNSPFEHLRIAINLSGHELEDPALVENMESILNNNGVEAHQLEVELTEEIFVENLDHNLEQLKRLNQLGVHLAIDDFGTGYSSLAYLRDFPVDLLKIDRSFITRVTERHDDAVITRAVINLAHNLGIQVCAEGIETQAQLQFLRAHRCDLAQGFLIGRPMPATDLEELIKQGISVKDLTAQG